MMFAIIITLCASAAMDDCQVYSLGHTATMQQCEAAAGIHREVLGPQTNYRLECQQIQDADNE